MAKNYINNNTCIECGNEATYTSPEYYCNFHWNVWWFSGVFGDLSTEEFNRCDPSEEERHWYNIVSKGIRVKRDKHIRKENK